VLQSALAAVTAIEDEQGRRRALGEVLDLLEADSTLLIPAREVADGIQDESLRAQALFDVAVKLQGEARDQLIQHALVAMDAKTLLERVAAADVSAIRSTMAALRADSPLLQRLMEAVASIEDEDKRAAALQTQALRIPREPACQAAFLGLALGISGRRMVRIASCMTIVRRSPELLSYDLWHNVLTQSRLRRRLLLEVTGDLAWCAVKITGRTEEARRIALAVQEICRWWP
jgi:hypothetical protein